MAVEKHLAARRL